MTLLDGYLTKPQLAKELGVCTKTIERWERKGLPFTSLGQRRLYKKSSVLGWIDNRERRTLPPNIHIVRKPANGEAA